MTGPQAGALEGIRIVDLSQVLSGPLCGAILADQGADVIKVEMAGGDPVRSFGPAKGDLSATFISANRGKRGICVDLKSDDGREILDALIARADVLIENFRPGTMERLGFGYDHCKARNPRLIFASITGFGPDGPYANIRVYDPVVQAVSGIAATQLDHDRQPSLVRSLVVDKWTGLTAAQAITAALFHRERSGEGQRIDIAMLDAALAFNWPDAMFNHCFVDDPPPVWPEYGDMIRLWKCADGHVAASALQAAEVPALMRAVGRDDLADDPRFNTLAKRLANKADWEAYIDAALAVKTRAALMESFAAEGAVGGRVNGGADVHTDAQVAHNDAIVEMEHPGTGRIRVARPAARFSATPQHRPRAAPHLGEHDAEVRAELGLTRP